ncbi:MAG: triple tyrosine motif-containing protein [Bacteroidia bacterium]|nr:triple tyrosine motif-containing protein [Bacteroidia bacterium]
MWCLGSEVVGYEGGRWTLYDGIVKDDLGRKSGYFITCGAVAPDGNLWMGTTDNGVVVYNPERNFVRTLKHDPDNSRSLCNNQIKKIAIDRAGVAWVVTGIGVSKVAPRLKKFYTLQNKPGDPASLVDNYIKSLAENDKGQIVVATIDGLNLFDAQKNTVQRLTKERYAFLEDWFGGATFVYGDRRGTVWLGMTLGVIEWSARGAREHLGRTAVSVCVEDTVAQCLWFVGDDSLLFRYQAGRWEKFGLKKFGSEHWPEVRAMAVTPDGALWMGTDYGLIRRTPDGAFRRFGKADGMADEIVTHLVPTADGLWLATRNGLHFFDGERFLVYGRNSGLASANIAALLPGDGEELWVAHDKGLTRWNPRLRLGVHYTQEHGLQSNAFHDGVAYRDRQGRLYFGGPNGLNYFYPHEIVQSAHPALPAVVKFYIDDKETHTDSSIYYKTRLYLKHSDANIGFSLAAINYYNPSENVIRYRMLGVDKDWVQIRNVEGHIVRYPGLEPGDYVFEVIASNDDKVFSDYVRRLYIKIYPPFWDTVWFYVGETLFLVTLLVIAHYLKKTRTRSRLATVFTFATLIFIFEVVSLIVENYLDKYSYGMPLVKLALNVSLAILLNPVEKLANRFLGGGEMQIEKY